MKRSIQKSILALLITFSAASVIAEPHCKHGKGFGHGKHANNPEMMFKHIPNLTEEQKSEIRLIFQENATLRSEHKGQARVNIHELDPTSADYQQQVEELANTKAAHVKSRTLRHANKHAQIQSILTEEQREALKEVHEHRKAKFKENRHL